MQNRPILMTFGTL